MKARDLVRARRRVRHTAEVQRITMALDMLRDVRQPDEDTRAAIHKLEAQLADLKEGARDAHN